jgi:argininosuccinate lyase
MFAALDTVTGCLTLAPAIIANAELQREKIAARLDDGFLDATALMEYLIQRGVPMRSGHEIVGKLVAHCEAGGRRLSDLTLVEMQGACSAIGEDVFDVLGAANAAAALCSYGSGGPEQVAQQLAAWSDRLN